MTLRQEQFLTNNTSLQPVQPLKNLIHNHNDLSSCSQLNMRVSSRQFRSVHIYLLLRVHPYKTPFLYNSIPEVKSELPAEIISQDIEKLSIENCRYGEMRIKCVASITEEPINVSSPVSGTLNLTKKNIHITKLDEIICNACGTHIAMHVDGGYVG